MLPERLARRVVHESPWVSLYVDRIRLGTGRLIEDMHVVHVGEAGVAVVLEDERRRVAMVRVPRYATATNEWELPQGRAAALELPRDAAGREALEETGWTSDAPELLHTFHPLPGLSDHVMHVVRRRAVAEIGDFDKDEIDDVRWVELSEIRAMLAERRVVDGFTMLGLFLHLQDRG